MTPTESEEKKNEVWELYVKGWSYRKIAQHMGISRNTIGPWLAETMAELAEERKKYAKDYLEKEMKILDDLTEVWKEKGECGDPQAAEILIKIQNRRSRYLGLDAPEKREITGAITLGDLVTGVKKTPEEEAEENAEKSAAGR